MAHILLEICCGSVHDAVNARNGGADRVELCSALFLGGLTPSLASLLEAKQRTDIPVMAMLRPRQGGFCYDEVDFAVMLRDAQLFLEHRADGVVLGILREDSTIDAERCREILSRIPKSKGKTKVESVFHRAFDLVPDPAQALEELIDLGFTRVLTSGQRETALAGSELIGNLVRQARGRIEILPGAGVRPHNVRELLAATGCTQIHATAFCQRHDPSAARTEIRFGDPASPPESEYDLVSQTDVTLLRDELDAI